MVIIELAGWRAKSSLGQCNDTCGVSWHLSKIMLLTVWIGPNDLFIYFLGFKPAPDRWAGKKICRNLLHFLCCFDQWEVKIEKVKCWLVKFGLAEECIHPQGWVANTGDSINIFILDIYNDKKWSIFLAVYFIL